MRGNDKAEEEERGGGGGGARRGSGGAAGGREGRMKVGVGMRRRKRFLRRDKGTRPGR